MGLGSEGLLLGSWLPRLPETQALGQVPTKPPPPIAGAP